MNLYDVISLENQIEQIAEANEGEVPEHLFQQLIEQQTQSLVQIENLCKYIRNLETGIDMCKTEIERINKMKDKATNRIESIKKYIVPYIKQQKKIEVGTFKVTTRKSKKVIIIDKEKIPINYRSVVPETWDPDKAAIKQDIKKGVMIPGAELQEIDNLQIK